VIRFGEVALAYELGQVPRVDHYAICAQHVMCRECACDWLACFRRHAPHDSIACPRCGATAPEPLDFVESPAEFTDPEQFWVQFPGAPRSLRALPFAAPYPWDQHGQPSFLTNSWTGRDTSYRSAVQSLIRENESVIAGLRAETDKLRDVKAGEK
jgi:hypothetical protein